jgi:hypothetical protein
LKLKLKLRLRLDTKVPYAIAVDKPKTGGTELRPSLDSDSSLHVCFTLWNLGLWLWGCRAVVALSLWALALELWK